MKNIFLKLICFSLAFIMTIMMTACGNDKEVYEEQRNKNQDIHEVKLSKEQWIQDIDFVRDIIEIKRGSVYPKSSKEEVLKKIDNLKNNIGNIKEEEIRYELTSIVASITDGHTLLSIYDVNARYVYPLGAYWFKDKIILVKTNKELKKHLGKEIVAINNIPIQQVIDKVKKLIPVETSQVAKFLSVDFLVNISALKYCKISDGGDIKVKLKSLGGKEEEVTVRPAPRDCKQFLIEDRIRIKKAKNNIDSSMNEKYYYYRYMKQDKAMYLRYNICYDKKHNPIKLKEAEQLDFSALVDNMIKDINKHPELKKLIIDLRYNGGGVNGPGERLAIKLKQVKKLEGKVCFLTGRATFSSGVCACMQLKGWLNAVSFGEETGGKVNFQGNVMSTTLPNSKIEFRYSTVNHIQDPEIKGGFVPKYKVEQSIEDYLNGIDTVYEAAVNNMK